MSRFRNRKTGVVVSVDDSKDGRFDESWESVDEPKKAATKKSSTSKK